MLDFRREPPVPEDLSVPIESHLNRTQLKVLLGPYPVQELVSFMTQKVALKSGRIGHFLALDAHLTSLNPSFGRLTTLFRLS
jgi:hypothetical protein